MERRKKLLSILGVSIITATLFTPMLLLQTANAVDPSSWYTNVSGVLDTDYYKLYPFKTDKSLKIGFSKFGEMIDSINNIGLEYRDRDAFAPPSGASVPPEITKNKWESGWLINITYHGTAGMRNVWAMAQHADLLDYGKDWIRVDDSYGYTGALTEATEDPRDVGRFIGTGVGPVNGGRKTNGTAATDDIRVLYNEPRLFIARTVTHIYDWDPGWSADEPLVDVVFTFIFNKDKKEVIVIKDIKEATTKFVFGEVTVPIDDRSNATVNGAIIQFSNRGEWDIGPANTYDSYVHFYVAGGNPSQGQSTVYDEHYHLNPTLYPATWLKLSSYGVQPGSSGTYDLAQIVAKDRLYVGWAAFWPSLSNWHVDAGYQDKWWKSLKQGEDAVDTGIEPFMSPYLIGEWDFALTKTALNASGRHFDRQFRGVTVYGLSDNWIGDDAGRSGGSNVIDREVQYQLAEVFNPWDLYSAVEKDTERYVQFHTVTTAEKAAAVSGTNLNITLANSPVKYASTWETYCSFSERVEWGGTMKHPARSVWVSTGTLSTNEPYELYVNTTSGIGTITIRAASVPTAGSEIKILYSTETEYTYEDYVQFDFGPTSVARAASNSIDLLDSLTWVDKLGVTHTISVPSFDFTVRNVTALTGNKTWTYGGYTEHWEAYPFKVFKEETTTLRWESDNFGKVNQTQTSGGKLELAFDDLDIIWNITGPAYTDVHMNVLHPEIYYKYNVTYNTVTRNYTYVGLLRLGYEVEGEYTLYSEKIPGKYEWVVVGNHSRAIDSIGAAMVSAAFKNKQVEMGNGGLDQPDAAWGPNIPHLLSNMGHTTWRPSGPPWANYYDSIGRLALVDDWCTRYPVSTSNIITVGGPSANLVSEYFNSFTQAVQIYGGIPNILLSDVIFATSCWNTTKGSNYLGQYYYRNGQFVQGTTGTGIGVITTYKDLNGTVGFMIHGWSGDDTYYTTKWFHEHGIYYLQTENRGVTTLIIRIDYNNDSPRTQNPMPPAYDYDSHNPQITILERLGTISEKTPHDP